MSSSVMEELEMKEPTPSLAPSQYESPLYTKKWRILLTVFLGVTLIGVCVLGFYVSVQARAMGAQKDIVHPVNHSTSLPPRSTNIEWRLDKSTCLPLKNVTCSKGYGEVPLVVIAMDGLRPDFLTEEVTPAMSYLRRCGVTADSLVPTYPTTTFPNMYTIATGLYPESHGIIGNEMYDPVTKKNFDMNDHSYKAPEWWQGEPIWNTLNKQGKKSATYFWVGSDVRIEERNPFYWHKYKVNETFDHRMKEVVMWLTMAEEERPDLVMVYLEQPRQAIEEFGPGSQEARDGLEVVDRLVDELMGSLHQLDLAHCINVLLVSDHGASPASCTSSFYLENFISDIETKAFVYTGAVGRLRARSQDKAEEEEMLETLSCKSPKVRALPKKLLPRRYHYANNPRIEGVILDTQPNTRVVTNSQNYCKHGEHGFNNLEPTMQATFVGFGPHLKVNYKTPSFRNVELYNFMCTLLNVKPAQNNGTMGSLNHLLRNTPPSSSNTKEDKDFVEESVLPPPLQVGVTVGGEGQEEQPCTCYVTSPPPVEHEEEVISGSNSTETLNSTNSTNGSSSSNSSTTAAPSTTPAPPTQAELSLQLNNHAPWGSPRYSSSDTLKGSLLKVLLHSSYVIGLHETLNLGLWVSFTITNKTIQSTEKEKPLIPSGIEVKPEEVRVVDKKPACWRADTRLERAPADQCGRMLTTDYQQKNIQHIQLFPEELETEDLLVSEGHLLSNLAPVRTGYLEGAHAAMVGALRGWASTLGSINVIHGPVFDYDLDGHQDEVAHVLNTVKPLVPSDYFYVVSLCSNTTKSCHSEPQQVLSFVFPNTEFHDNCLMSDKEYLQYHLTTVRDIELLTGFSFFRKTFVSESLRHKVYQPTEIWPLTAVEDTSTTSQQ